MNIIEKQHRAFRSSSNPVTAGQQRRVLVYDDDELYAEECAEAMARFGFIVETRAGRVNFVPLIKEFEPNLLILDLHMPDFDGVEVLRALRDYEGKDALSVILVSAGGDVLLASAASIAEAYGIHLLGCLEKPLKLAELKPLVADFMADDKSAQI
jgi:DNA-binding response OmpR family regulator